MEKLSIYKWKPPRKTTTIEKKCWRDFQTSTFWWKYGTRNCVLAPTKALFVTTNTSTKIVLFWIITTTRHTQFNANYVHNFHNFLSSPLVLHILKHIWTFFITFLVFKRLLDIDEKNLKEIQKISMLKWDDESKTPDLLKLGIAFAGSLSLQFPICLHQILGPWNIELQE